MIDNVKLNNINTKSKINIKPRTYDTTSFEGAFGGTAKNALKKALVTCVKPIQKCEQNPMLNVAALDLITAIIPRTFSETVIGSKQKDKDGKHTHRKFNVLGGFEAFRRESSGLFINCLIPGFVVIGAAKLLNAFPIMGKFNKSNLTTSWANSDTINKISHYYLNSNATTPKDKIVETLKTMIHDLEGVNGDVAKDGLKEFKGLFANDSTFDRLLGETADSILDTSKNAKKSNLADNLYKYIVKKTGIDENIKFKGEKNIFSSNLEHLLNSSSEMLHGVVKEGIKDNVDITKYFKNAKKLVNAKSGLGLAAVIALAISAQPINRWITHKISGKKGAPIYNDNQDRILTMSEKIKLNAEKCVAIPLMVGVAALSMILDKPSLKMFQFKGRFPTMDQARIISTATFSSRIASAEDSNELRENTIRDIATFSSFYFLGDYAAKAIATILEKTNKDGIKLLNKISPLKENANIFERIWHWAKHTKMKSTVELSAIPNAELASKAKILRAGCQLGNIIFSLLSLGLFIPIYTRSQTNKKARITAEQKLNAKKHEVFIKNFIGDASPSFKAFYK